MFARIQLSTISVFILPKQCTRRGNNKCSFLTFLNPGSPTTRSLLLFQFDSYLRTLKLYPPWILQCKRQLYYCILCMGTVATCIYNIKVKQSEWRMNIVSACDASFNVIQQPPKSAFLKLYVAQR